MKKINFEYISKYAYDVCERPKPSKDFIPKWFRDLSAYYPIGGLSDGSGPALINRKTNASAKKCTPMLDGIVSGYTVPLWADVLVRQTENGPEINWKVSKNVFIMHDPASIYVPSPPGYDQIVFKYLTHFRIRTPQGYSVAISQPSGHYDLPFYTIPAIIDTDKSVIDNNFPVWIRSGFEGIIEKGTPIAQIFPFKRDSWEASSSYITEEEYIAQEDKGFNLTIVNNYVKNIWSKKEFK